MRKLWLMALTMAVAMGSLPLLAQQANVTATNKNVRVQAGSPPGFRPPPGARPPAGYGPPSGVGRPGGFRPPAGYGPPPTRPNPGQSGWAGGRRDRDSNRRYGNRNSRRYGPVVYYGVGASYWPTSYTISYSAGGREHHERNWRYVNVRSYDSLSVQRPRTVDYQVKLYYDRVKSRDFPKALSDLAKGVFGALKAWPDNPEMVSHSYALERLFKHLDMKLQAKLAYAEDVSYATRMSYGETLVQELLAKLVDSITIEGDQYLVRFKLINGNLSPWVLMPVIFNRQGWAEASTVRQGGFYYQGPYEYFQVAASANY